MGTVGKAAPTAAESRAEAKKLQAKQPKAQEAGVKAEATGIREDNQTAVNTTAANSAVNINSQAEPAAVGADSDDDSEIGMAEEVSEDDTMFDLPFEVEDSNAEDGDEQDNEAEAGEILHKKYSMMLPK